MAVDEGTATELVRQIVLANQQIRDARVKRAKAVQAATDAGLSYREIGRRMGLSHEQIRQYALHTEEE